MSAGNPTGSPLPESVAAKANSGEDRREIVVISHSNLFYWWPVWAVCFLMGILTYLDGTLMVTVPPGTKPVVEVKVPSPGDPSKMVTREAWVLPEGKKLPRENKEDEDSQPKEAKLHMSQSKNYGVIFVFTLLLVIVITNVPLRGMWSVIVIITLILLTVIFALAGWWEYIFEQLGRLDIRINAGGYFVLGGVLFIIWLITFAFFDRQIYMVFSQAQFKVRTEIGGGERVYSTVGLQLERQRNDLFRHWILGFGSGDLIVRTTGAQAHHFDFPNVLSISRKMREIESILVTQKVDVVA